MTENEESTSGNKKKRPRPDSPQSDTSSLNYKKHLRFANEPKIEEQTVEQIMKPEDISKLITSAIEQALAPINEKLNQIMEQQNTRIINLEQRNNELELEVSELHMKCDNLEQYSRRNNLLFMNVPEVKGELPLQTAHRISDVMSLNLTSRDIDACHRLPGPPNIPRPFLIKFLRRHQKTESLITAKKGRYRQDAFGGDKGTPVYVNEHLTRPTAQLFRETSKLKELGYRVETRDCAVFVKKGSERRRKITAVDQVNTIYTAHHPTH